MCCRICRFNEECDYETKKKYLNGDICDDFIDDMDSDNEHFLWLEMSYHKTTDRFIKEEDEDLIN